MIVAPRMKSASDPNGTLAWLLAGDPAIRWQARRDLTDGAPGVVAREQRKVAKEGWGARLLARQDPEGTWARGLYTPKWTSTTYTMLLLRDLGLPPSHRQAKTACGLLLDNGMRRDGGITYDWTESPRTRLVKPGRSGAKGGRSETCITGMVLSILSYFRYDDDRLETIADHLLKQQMPDGGWNCRRPYGATHASLHTTISVLEGLKLYEQYRVRKVREVRAAQHRGREFLLAHRLFRSHRTGQIIHPVFLRPAFPPRWHYDVLRALDYFQAVQAPRDERLAEAVTLLRRKRRPDGRWNLEHGFSRGSVFFEMERLGKPSRWNTLRALRVLRWWEGNAGSLAAGLIETRQSAENPPGSRTSKTSMTGASIGRSHRSYLM